MTKNNKVKRYLAAMLTVIMIFQQSGTNAIFANGDNTPAAVTAEEEQQPDQTPETTPETTPEETPAPETTPEVTEAPETTEAPEITETPEETPTPEPEATEAPKTDFTYKDDEKTIVAVISDSKALPEGTTLVVNEVELSDEQKEMAENSLDSSEQMSDYTAYDMHFEKDGVEIEPQNATVTVSIQFNEVKEIGNETVNQEASKIQVLHLDDESNVSDVTKDVAVDEEGNVKSADFVTDSFSIFILAQTVENNRKFVYEDDNVKITAVTDKKEEVLNSNLVKMKVEILDDSDSEEYKKIENILKEEYEKDNKVLLGFRYYDFTFLKGEEEVEPTEKVKISIERKNAQFPDSIPEGLVNDVEIYHVSDNEDTISAEKLSAKIEDNDKNAMVTGNFQMDSFSGVTETYGASGSSMSRSEIVSDLGIAQNFAVFATNFNNDNHMEGAIAVQHFLGNSSSLGNTDAVYNYTTQFDLVIKKKVNGDTGKKQEFKFGIFMKQGDSYNKIQEICVTTNDQGEGTSDVISHEIFTSGAKYYIFELDDSGNPIINGEGIVNGVKNSVSYSTNGLSGSVVESVGNTSYIEFLEGSGSTTDLIQSTGKGKASLVIGSTNKIGWNNENQGYVEGRGGCQYSIEKSKVDVTVAADPFPIDFSTEMSNLSTLSENLAKMLPAESSDVKTIYVPIDSSGNVDYQNVLDNGNKIFDDNNAWNDIGASTNGKLLVFNVDCSAAGNNVELQGCRIDGNDPQNWNEKANSVIWNFYTKNGESYSPYTGKITYKGGLGTILAPEATVECISSTNGSVIASSVSHPGCEIHYIKVTDVVNVVKKTVTCTNTPNKGTLTVTKTVEGNGGDKNKEFEFTVTLNDKSIAGMYGDISFENGVATFTLYNEPIN